MRAVDGTRVRVTLSDGSVLEGRLARAYRDKASIKLEGSTVDLKGAYKQFCICMSDRCFAVLVVWDCEKCIPCLRISYALGFGATLHVHSFNRCARGLKQLLIS